MIQILQPISQQTSTPQMASSIAVREPVIWGLRARELHDAFWRSRGVQCVRRGDRQQLLRGAELFLLTEPNQMALFDLAQFTERLMWNNAAVTRLRLIVAEDENYSEHVVADERGLVSRIERRYRPRVLGYSRLLLTTSQRVANLWMAARSWREGWDRVRRSVNWSRVDHWKCQGEIFADTDQREQRAMIDSLVQRWLNPNQAIAGLEELEPGVWHVAGDPVEENVVRVGPVWLGRNAGTKRPQQRCIIGPAWHEDAVESRDIAARLKDIIDIENVGRSIETERPRPRTLYHASKRAFDIIAASGALVAMMPLMVVIAMLIMLEDGRPILFAHRRQGKGGRVFRCWKFRTMQRGAERLARQLENQNLCDGPQVNILNDPRVTRVGRILRPLDLDELPQFWNVLLGQMSLVGPRPSPDDENQYCPAWRDLRLSVRPGITGLWQLKRTREPGEDFQEWIKYDIEYVQRAGFWEDLKILARTAHMLLARRIRSATHKKR